MGRGVGDVLAPHRDDLADLRGVAVGGLDGRDAREITHGGQVGGHGCLRRIGGVVGVVRVGGGRRVGELGDHVVDCARHPAVRERRATLSGVPQPGGQG